MKILQNILGTFIMICCIWDLSATEYQFQLRQAHTVREIFQQHTFSPGTDFVLVTEVAISANSHDWTNHLVLKVNAHTGLFFQGAHRNLIATDLLDSVTQYEIDLSELPNKEINTFELNNKIFTQVIGIRFRETKFIPDQNDSATNLSDSHCFDIDVEFSHIPMILNRKIIFFYSGKQEILAKIFIQPQAVQPKQ